MIFRTLTSGLVGCLLLITSGGTARAGAIFVTGHDADQHGNGFYQRAGLDFLVFGQEATGAQIAERANTKVAYLGNLTGTNFGGNGSNFGNSAIESGYTNRTFINLNSVTWTNVFTGDYDVIMVGTGADFVSTAGSNALNAHASNFAQYFNDGGAIFIHTDQGLGDDFYDFVPSFGTTNNNTISNSGAFTATQAGLDIGLTEAIVDADVTHSFYTGVDTNLFTVFETFNQNDAPVAFGLRDGTIDDGGFNTVPEPTSLALLGMGALGLIGYRTRRRKKDQAA